MIIKVQQLEAEAITYQEARKRMKKEGLYIGIRGDESEDIYCYRNGYFYKSFPKNDWRFSSPSRIFNTWDLDQETSEYIVLSLEIEK